MELSLRINGISVTVHQTEIEAVVRDHLLGMRQPARAALPRIGSFIEAQGGCFAGIMAGRDNKPDYPLILAGFEPEGELDWNAAIAKADELNIEGLRDFRLPTRHEQRLLWANLPEHFKSECYWSSEQHAGNAEYAWFQYFGSGSQLSSLKSYRLRARFVRTGSFDNLTI